MAEARALEGLRVLVPDRWTDYELLDSGSGAKLERFGKYVIRRPESRAFWKPELAEEVWRQADAAFVEGSGPSGSAWEFHSALPESWMMTYGGLRFLARPTPFRHLGFFPEQAAHWDWLGEAIRESGREVRVLNLFGYTGLATLAAAKAGASVTHIDASKKSIAWARENQELSGLGAAKIRWIPDDALKFVQREGRRGSRYDVVVLDPPKFGRGPKGEVWKLEDSLAALVEGCVAILSERPLGMVMTVYAADISPLSVYYLFEEHFRGRGGLLEAGELALREKGGRRLLPEAIFGRWSVG